MVEEDVVAPNTELMRKVANSYMENSVTLDGLKVKLDNSVVTPGDFPMGMSLKKRFDESLDNYGTFLTNLKTGSYELGRGLLKVAKLYDNAEELNKGDAERLAELIDTLSVTFNGIGTVIPKPI